MNRLTHKKSLTERRSHRTRSMINRGSSTHPRLTLYISAKHINAQIIDDQSQKTLVSASTVGKKLSGTMTEKAGVVGEEIALKAKKAKINKVVLDRGPKLYHGRVKAFAEAARKSGLEF